MDLAWQFTITPRQMKQTHWSKKLPQTVAMPNHFQGDLSDVSMVRDLFSEIRDSMGDVTGIVNNASLFSFDDIDSLSKQSWDSHMHVNALVPLLMISELHRNMPSGCVGSVVNILDQKISQPNPDYLSYTASRYAMAGMTETLRKPLSKCQG